MTVIAKKLGEKGSLEDALYTQEQADQVGFWLCYYEQRLVEVVVPFLQHVVLG